MDLSIITVTYNSEKYIAQQMRSIQSGADGLDYEQIVADNASVDSTLSEIINLQVKIIKNQINLGFAAANNLAIKQAVGEYILFLNPDMEIKCPGMLKEMVAYMRSRPEVGVMSCKLVDENGQVNVGDGPRRFPRILDQILVILKIPHLFKSTLKRYYYQDIDLEKIQEVENARGAFMLVRREIIDRLGRAFDERFFIWFEDVDFCRTVRQMGYKIIYHPDFECVDLVGQSFAPMPSYLKQKMFLTSMLAYFKKWEPWYKWIWIWLFRPVGLFMTWLYVKLK